MKNIIITFFSILLWFNLFCQEESKRFGSEMGKLSFEIIFPDDTAVKVFEMTFFDYGKVLLFSGHCSLDDSISFIGKGLGSETSSLVNGIVVPSDASPNSYLEQFFKSNDINLYKKNKTKYLKRKCEIFYHYELEDLSGVIIYYNNIPVYITNEDNKTSWILRCTSIVDI